MPDRECGHELDICALSVTDSVFSCNTDITNASSGVPPIVIAIAIAIDRRSIIKTNNQKPRSEIQGRRRLHPNKSDGMRWCTILIFM